MSDITNNIKASGQVVVNTTQNPNTHDARNTAGSENLTVGAPQTDKVSLTDSATQLQSLQQAISDAPDISQQRVEELKAAIDNGSYQVDVAELAANMINFEQQI